MKAIKAEAWACSWCGSSTGCDCIQRLHCSMAGVIGHGDCGPCAHDPGKPKFACMECFRGSAILLAR